MEWFLFWFVSSAWWCIYQCHAKVYFITCHLISIKEICCDWMVFYFDFFLPSDNVYIKLVSKFLLSFIQYAERNVSYISKVFTSICFLHLMMNISIVCPKFRYILYNFHNFQSKRYWKGWEIERYRTINKENLILSCSIYDNICVNRFLIYLKLSIIFCSSDIDVCRTYLSK